MFRYNIPEGGLIPDHLMSEYRSIIDLEVIYAADGFGGFTKITSPNSEDMSWVPTTLSDPITTPLHYSKYKIEPKVYIMENNIPWAEGSVIKYITRWRDKGGVSDLFKAREFINMLIQKEENVEK